VGTVLIATDADEIFDEVDAALGDDSTTVARVRAGKAVRSAVDQLDPDLVVLDLQIGNMGGMATCMDLRLEESADRLPPQRVLMLLDRHDDIFLANRADADGWLIKPIDSLRLRRAATEIIAGGTYTEGVVDDALESAAPDGTEPKADDSTEPAADPSTV
jgi:DNA-binding response OmpR family regulator